MGSDHDQVFLQILHEEKNIVNFLNVFFGFLYRCTDFYIESNSEQKLGFPPGVAEKLVLNSMYKWKNISPVIKESTHDIVNNSISESNELTAMQNVNCRFSPPVAQEIEIDSCNKLDTTNRLTTQLVETDHTSDSYNGAIRDNYIWTQTLDDLDVLVKIPEHIKTPKQTRVNINSDEIKIDIKPCSAMKDSEWDNIFNSKLSFKVRRDESVWSIVSGKHISIHLEKAVERWWEALIVDEPKIELNKIDCTKYFDDMAQEEQMKVQELMWNHQQKLLGKPTSEQIYL
ncbi:nudC domain-containing protein 3 isoform X2 [Odontomachus brunneus]|uniref:nudC domain-containing protein 3 isoform X2 n=1 Tax=Odontomachus brunneus TaxID=486640 RepID=UPI0013F23388|nr:nudC domain-containing protein 3 isoform X2 [Odontomachus brunneus]